MRVLFLAVLLLAASATPAVAKLSGYDCQVYFGEDDYTPPEVLEVLERERGGAIRKCSHSADYEFLSDPSWHPLGVCQVTKWHLVKEAESLQLIPSKTSAPGVPGLSMMVSTEGCPRQDDPRYIPTESITAGVFVVAVRFWEGVSSSENGYEALLAGLSGDNVSQGYGRDLKELENYLTRGKAELSAVRLGGDDKRSAPHIAIDLGSSGTFWSLLVDFNGGDLVVIGLGQTIVN